MATSRTSGKPCSRTSVDQFLDPTTQTCMPCETVCSPSVKTENECTDLCPDYLRKHQEQALLKTTNVPDFHPSSSTTLAPPGENTVTMAMVIVSVVSVCVVCVAICLFIFYRKCYRNKTVRSGDNGAALAQSSHKDGVVYSPVFHTDLERNDRAAASEGRAVGFLHYLSRKLGGRSDIRSVAGQSDLCSQHFVTESQYHVGKSTGQSNHHAKNDVTEKHVSRDCLLDSPNYSRDASVYNSQIHQQQQQQQQRQQQQQKQLQPAEIEQNKQQQQQQQQQHHQEQQQQQQRRQQQKQQQQPQQQQRKSQVTPQTQHKEIRQNVKNHELAREKPHVHKTRPAVSKTKRNMADSSPAVPSSPHLFNIFPDTPGHNSLSENHLVLTDKASLKVEGGRMRPSIAQSGVQYHQKGTSLHAAHQVSCDSQNSKRSRILISLRDSSEQGATSANRVAPLSHMTQTYESDHWESITELYQRIHNFKPKFPWLVACMISRDHLEVVVNLQIAGCDIERAYDLLCQELSTEKERFIVMTS